MMEKVIGNVICVGDDTKDKPCSKKEFLKKFKTLDITLEEIRLIYNLEESRRQSLESKTGLVLGYVGVLLALFSVVGLNSPRYLIFLLPFIIPLIFCIIFGFLVFKVQTYETPHKEVKDFFQYAEMPRKQLRCQFIMNYINSIDDLKEKNKKKVNYLKKSFWCAIIANICLLITLIVFAISSLLI